MKIRKSILKIISLFLIIGLNYSGLFAVGETMAYFNDKEISENNVYTAGTLDFSLFSPHDNFVSEEKVKVENMKQGDVVMRMIQVHQEGNLPFKYTIRTEKVSGDDDFCDALELKARLEGEIKYPAAGENSLMSFNFPPVEMIDPPGIDSWQFKILLPDNAPDNLQNKTCEFKFVFEGWQDNVENYKENGFDDVEEIGNELLSSEWQNSDWVKVDYPDGGEVWYIGRHYNILWETGDFDNCQGKLKINIWYSANSGASWANVVKNTKDDGDYNWRVPLFLFDEAGDIYFTASAEARIKVVATCSSDSAITAWDMSAEDFCPPIDYDLLTPEEIMVLESLGLFSGSGSVKDNNVSDNISGAVKKAESEKEIDKNEDILEDNNKKENGEVEEIGDDDIIADNDSGDKEEIEKLEIGEINNSNSDGGENKDENAADKNEDAKNEEFVLTPKEEILPDDGNDDSSNDGGNGNNDDSGEENDGNEDDEVFEKLGLDVKEEIEKINNDNGGDLEDNDNSVEDNFNKNSVDCVQVIK